MHYLLTINNDIKVAVRWKLRKILWWRNLSLTVCTPVSTWLPRQFIREGRKEVEKRPGNDHVVINGHQSRDDEHPVTNTLWGKNYNFISSLAILSGKNYNFISSFVIFHFFRLCLAWEKTIQYHKMESTYIYVSVNWSYGYDSNFRSYCLSINLPVKIGEYFQQVNGPALEYWPMANSSRKMGIPRKASAMQYGIKKAPEKSNANEI